MDDDDKVARATGPSEPIRPPAPAGWRLRLADGVRVLRDGEAAPSGDVRLVGGYPLRVLTLSSRGAHLLSGWLAGQPVAAEGVAEAELARRLMDAGLLDPDPPPRPHSASATPTGSAEVTIVIPVYADPERLRTCLGSLTAGHPVIVVDDGSPDGDSIAAVAEQFRVRYIRHACNRGPAAARNTGWRSASTPLVAFLDADCTPPPGFPGRLLDHLEDPAIGLAAPRVTSPARRPGRIAAYERSRSSLDMGARASLVRPYSPVWYVPSAAMVARRETLGSGFDEALSLGEDVDLAWRLHDAGWQIRYDPSITVEHEDRVRPLAWYRRRIAYNESVAPLTRRHSERLPVLFLSPPAALAWGVSLSATPAAVLLLAAARALRLSRGLAGRVPGEGRWALRLSLEITMHEGRDLARALAGPWAPFAAAALATARGTRRRRLAWRLGILLMSMALGDWLSDRPALDPLTYAALRLADESSRGAGIWLGCLREHDFRALLPRQPPPPSRR